jgi:glutaredoxin
MNSAASPTTKDRITVYGVKWCSDCRRTKAVFEEESVPYVWIDIDENKLGEKFVRATNRGNRSVPTIIFPDGSILVEPSSGRLHRTLEAYKTKSTA